MHGVSGRPVSWPGVSGLGDLGVFGDFGVLVGFGVFGDFDLGVEVFGV